MAIQGNSECLWDEEWIKNLMESMRKEGDFRMASFPSFNARGTTSSSSDWMRPKDYYSEAVEVKIVKDKPEENMEPVLFDPKELDIDVKE